MRIRATRRRLGHGHVPNTRRKASRPLRPQNTNVLPQRDDMKVERDGNLRWLVVQRPPEQVFPRWSTLDRHRFHRVDQRSAFGPDRDGLGRKPRQDPESWLRQLLGAVLETAWDSGEREKFRTRVERVNGHTEIYISHTQMLEKRTGPDGAQVQWTNGKEDPA